MSAIQPDHAWVAVYSGDDALVKQVDLQSRFVTREWPRGAVKYAYGIAAGAGCVVSFVRRRRCCSRRARPDGRSATRRQARGCHAASASSRAAITAEIDGTVGLASIGATSRLIRRRRRRAAACTACVLNERRVLLATRGPASTASRRSRRPVSSSTR